MKQKMGNILEKIGRYKREEIKAAKARRSPALLEADAHVASPPRGFAAALRRRKRHEDYGLIAEIKKASPSKGLIRADFNPADLARSYAVGGATCLSVLTDTPSFQGHADDLRQARAATTLPVLRKDFIYDIYQVIEARSWGADCILLIMAAVDDILARDLEQAAHQLGMDVIAEVHDRVELDRALKLRTPLIGINNRDLKTFETNLDTTMRLAPHVPPDRLVISESSLSTPGDLAQLASIGVTSFLIGESLVRQQNVTAATKALLHRPEPDENSTRMKPSHCHPQKIEI